MKISKIALTKINRLSAEKLFYALEEKHDTTSYLRTVSAWRNNNKDICSLKYEVFCLYTIKHINKILA